MAKPDYDTTVARIAGNIASAMDHCRSDESIAEDAVRIARAIVAEVKRTEPVPPPSLTSPDEMRALFSTPSWGVWRDQPTQAQAASLLSANPGCDPCPATLLVSLDVRHKCELVLGHVGPHVFNLRPAVDRPDLPTVPAPGTVGA